MTTAALFGCNSAVGDVPYTSNPAGKSSAFAGRRLTMQKYVCTVCGYEYDPAAGDPDSGIAPGTAFEDLPEDWVCPVCGASKSDFSAA